MAPYLKANLIHYFSLFERNLEFLIGIVRLFSLWIVLYPIEWVQLIFNKKEIICIRFCAVDSSQNNNPLLVANMKKRQERDKIRKWEKKWEKTMWRKEWKINAGKAVDEPINDN